MLTSYLHHRPLIIYLFIYFIYISLIRHHHQGYNTIQREKSCIRGGILKYQNCPEHVCKRAGAEPWETMRFVRVGIAHCTHLLQARARAQRADEKKVSSWGRSWCGS